MRTARDVLLPLAAAAVLALAACAPGGGDRDEVEELLGVEVPASAEEIRHFRWQPSDELRFYTAYIKVRAPRADLLALVRRLRLHRYGDEGALPYLPTRWRTHPQVDLDWWDASRRTPRESWAAPFGTDGSIVAKIERGRLYAIVTDTGHREGTTAEAAARRYERTISENRIRVTVSSVVTSRL